MSKLIIDDLNFFESEFPGNSKVKGGAKKKLYKVSVDADADAVADAKADAKVYGTKVLYSVAAGVADGVASAVSFDKPAVAKVNVSVDIDAEV